MTSIMNLKYEIDTYLEQYADSRTTNWPLVTSIFYPVLISIAYVLTVKVLGPWLMQNRKPFQLKRTLIFYNFLQILFNIYLFYKASTLGWLTGGYSFLCQPVDYSGNPKALEMAVTSWLYYILKYIDLLDTVFSVLRKKQDQISVLHLYHHSVMPLMVWLGLKFAPGGNSTFFGFLNTFVHIVMHTYYLLSALGPKMRPYLWWKKYVTILQLVQFLIVLIHTIQLLVFNCDYPAFFSWLLIVQGCVFLALFGNFYNESYVEKKTPKRVQSSNGFSRTKTD